MGGDSNSNSKGNVPRSEPFTALDERAKAIERKVRAYLARGEYHGAAKLFDNEWRSAAVPLPIAIPFILVSPDHIGVARWLEKLSAKEDYELDVIDIRLLNGRPGKALVAKPSCSHDAETILLGYLPDEVTQILHKAGDLAPFYKPQLLALSGLGRGEELVVEAELVRPVLYRCSSCGRVHEEARENCRSCRARRRRRNYTVDEARERPLVPLERALNELTSWSGAEDDNDKAGE